MSDHRSVRALTLAELLVVLAALVVAITVVLPCVAATRASGGVQQSMSNLMRLWAAHKTYAADFNGRQMTVIRDDLGVYGGDVGAYNAANGGFLCNGPDAPAECHPPAIAGEACDGQVWAYWPQFSEFFFQPINFPGSPVGCSACAGWGSFRAPNLRPLHDYVNGLYHDPVFYAPNDTTVMDQVEQCLDLPCEFNPDCNPGWSSYAMSPASMFHPDVMRANADGGWQAPWELDHGYQGPALHQASFAAYKSLMIEHSWVQLPPAECNPAFGGCEPYYFNHGLESMPVTLFYDGSVRLLPNTEVFEADMRILKKTGGVDGLWHRETAFGDDGYFIGAGFDGAPISYHILTTNGIRGRDTIHRPPSPPADTHTSPGPP